MHKNILKMVELGVSCVCVCFFFFFFFNNIPSAPFTPFKISAPFPPKSPMLVCLYKELALSQDTGCVFLAMVVHEPERAI